MFPYSQAVTLHFFWSFFFFTEACSVFQLHQSASIEVAQLQQFLMYSPGWQPFAQTCCLLLTWCTPPSRSRLPQRKWKGTRPWRRYRWCLHQWVCRHTWNSTFSPPCSPPFAWTFSSSAQPPRCHPHRGFRCWSAGSAPGGWKSSRPGSCQWRTRKTKP